MIIVQICHCKVLSFGWHQKYLILLKDIVLKLIYGEVFVLFNIITYKMKLYNVFNILVFVGVLVVLYLKCLLVKDLGII